MSSVFTIYGCYIQFQFMLLTFLGYFQEIYENHPSGNTPIYENVPPRSLKILKWLTSKMAGALSLVIKRPAPQQKEDAIWTIITDLAGQPWTNPEDEAIWPCGSQYHSW